MARYTGFRWLFRMILRLGFGLRVTGGDRVPASGPVILAANHPSQIDPIVLAAAVRRRCTFLAAAELFTMPVLGALIRPFRPVPVRRGRFDRAAIRECIKRLGGGEALVIFPEGGISTDGRLQPAHDGLAFIAYHAGVPVVPVGVAGTYEVWPLGRRMPQRGKITVRFGEPIEPEGAPKRTQESGFTARVMGAISTLAGIVAAPAAERAPIGRLAS